MAICFYALPSHHQALLREDALKYLCRTRRPDGSWPSYCWSNCFYSSFTCLSLLRDLEPRLPYMSVIALEELDHIQSAFDLAFVLGIALLQNDTHLLPPLVDELLRHQNQTGGWKGAQTLRITDWSCYAPWDNPKGKLYADIGGANLTATLM